MAKKIYTLEIMYDTETEEVEYILEQCDKEGANDISCTWEHMDLGQYFDEETIRLFEEYTITLDELPEA